MAGDGMWRRGIGWKRGTIAWGPVTRSTHVILASILVTMLSVITIWQDIARYSLDIMGFVAVLALLPAPLLVHLYYVYKRPDPHVAAMSRGLCFLLVFGPCCTILTYFCLGLGLSRI